jgi:hypothetical protein
MAQVLPPIHRVRPVDKKIGAHFREMWADPVKRAALLEKRKAPYLAAKEAGRFSRAGIPTGLTRKTVKRFWQYAKFQATLTMKKLKKAGVLDDVADARAEDALHAAISVMKMDALQPKDRIAAARLVLDFTKAKPAQKQDITVSTAEDWLEAVTADNNGETDEGPDSGA